MRAMYYPPHTQIQKIHETCKLLSCFYFITSDLKCCGLPENVMNANTLETISFFIKTSCCDLSLFYLMCIDLIMQKGA